MTIKEQKIAELRKQIMINMAASEVGGLTEDEADHWYDEISFGVMDAFEGVMDD